MRGPSWYVLVRNFVSMRAAADSLQTTWLSYLLLGGDYVCNDVGSREACLTGGLRTFFSCPVRTFGIGDLRNKFFTYSSLLELVVLQEPTLSWDRVILGHYCSRCLCKDVLILWSVVLRTWYRIWPELFSFLKTLAGFVLELVGLLVV